MHLNSRWGSRSISRRAFVAGVAGVGAAIVGAGSAALARDMQPQSQPVPPKPDSGNSDSQTTGPKSLGFKTPDFELPKAKNIVLAHGLFADGSCWSEVIARLQGLGFNCTAVQNPLTTLPEAVESVTRVLARQDGPTVLVGHSFSGMLITEAGVHQNVSALVYVAARAPDADEDYGALAAKFPTPPASAGIVFDGEEGRLTQEAFLRDFAGDVPRERAMVLYAVQAPFRRELLKGRVKAASWRTKPSFYAVSTQDRTINPELERFMAKRMGAKTIELPSSHVSMISHPDEIAALITEAAGR